MEVSLTYKIVTLLGIMTTCDTTRGPKGIQSPLAKSLLKKNLT